MVYYTATVTRQGSVFYLVHLIWLWINVRKVMGYSTILLGETTVMVRQMATGIQFLQVQSYKTQGQRNKTDGIQTGVGKNGKAEAAHFKQGKELCGNIEP